MREAFHRSIDVEAIKRTVMRGQSFPTDLMVAPGINGYIEGARQAAGAAEAGRGQEAAGRRRLSERLRGRLDCPNDRYVNDEKICQAVVAMLASVGIKVNLRAQTRNLYFAKILRKSDGKPGETSFYMLGWSPARPTTCTTSSRR